ncbi:precorrin-3B synthase [Nostoc sp. CENA67]|uniref:Precorrin-3B synthase n=1 Tax=Amazonocrinis nigriterrae CENA67 TaxID=2794033 RepID=A0A8J7HTL8_9NOST|nr:precorrin-3B synthase [Amazonocrinis nigriterrae]MBH8563910.1 precorrin-3B synthase [Amazonocrinis nigriterrae CENA67]
MPTPAVSSRYTYGLLSALHGEGVLVLLSGIACPGLFYVTPACDGILSRIRIPGGILNNIQCRAIADIADKYGGGYIDVTNRANLQVREIRTQINTTVLKHLQDLGLGSSNTNVDHIRNIMTSPTAGIDPQELIDTRPFVQDWDNYIATHPHLCGLPAKFSVGFDGGGLVSVCDRPNDIAFAAVLVNNQVYFRLCLSIGAKGEPPADTGVLLTPEKCLPLLAALANVYLKHIDTNSKRKPRLRELLNSLGCENYLQEVEASLPFSLLHSEIRGNLTPQPPSLGGKGEQFPTIVTKESLGLKSDTHTQLCREIASKNGQVTSSSSPSSPLHQYQHIGIHPQRQPGLFYIGVVLPLGRLESQQMRGLADLAESYGSSIRLTPWQNLLLTDIPQQWVNDVQNKLAVLGLDSSPSNIKSALVACSGKRGCAAAATDTKGDALALAEYLETRVTLDHPINIHFSGCEKSCAQHSKSDITLLGVSAQKENGTVESYQVYIGDGYSHEKFGRELYQDVSLAKLPALLERMLKVYKIKRTNYTESFAEFANRYAIAQLKQLFS